MFLLIIRDVEIIQTSIAKRLSIVESEIAKVNTHLRPKMLLRQRPNTQMLQETMSA
jgi:hypothetical protein